MVEDVKVRPMSKFLANGWAMWQRPDAEKGDCNIYI
jgi:hypothetical protein